MLAASSLLLPPTVGPGIGIKGFLRFFCLLGGVGPDFPLPLRSALLHLEGVLETFSFCCE